MATAVLGPLLLHVVGWDRHRWNALAALNAGLAALIVYAGSRGAQPTGEPDGDRPGLRRTLVAFACAIGLWNVASEPVFFDGYGPQHPPFTYHVQFLLEAIDTRDPNLWIPRPGN